VAGVRAGGYLITALPRAPRRRRGPRSSSSSLTIWAALSPSRCRRCWRCSGTARPRVW